MAEALTTGRREGFGLATIMARKGVATARIGEALGLQPGEGPVTAGDAALRLIGTGPGTWLALRETAGPGFAAELRERLGPLASVSDQSGGYAMLRLAGPGARTVLQRGASIDLHPSVFAPGSAATTVIAHMGVIFWQVDDAPTYDVALFRSYCASFAHWLEATAAAL